MRENCTSGDNGGWHLVRGAFYPLDMATNVATTIITVLPLVIGDGITALGTAVLGGIIALAMPVSWKEDLGQAILPSILPFLANIESDTASLYAPDIYLYAAQPTEVVVRLGDPGALTSAVPSYPGTGWRVTATPSGAIFDGGKRYGHLWYEADVHGPWVTNQGWLVAGGRRGFMQWAETHLPGFGLSAAETGDFATYWRRHLPDAPYYLVVPQPESVDDAVMPLKISPRPVAVLRLWLYVEPLLRPVPIAPSRVQFPAVNRTRGLVAVEWGVAMP